MQINHLKYELQNIISGKSGSSYGAFIQTVASHLRSGKRTSPLDQSKHKNKPEETERLKRLAIEKGWVYDDIDPSKFISNGAEQSVYIKGESKVIKINDAIYYASWEDYFHNLLLHNFFFSDTAYQLLGFYNKENVLYAVVQQNFVKANAITSLDTVQEFLMNNGFINSKHHDYKHPELGLILEDLHDENVLTQNDMLYFIDTVFYIEPEIFWN